MKVHLTVSRILFCLLASLTFTPATTCAQTITHVPLFTIDGDSFGAQLGKWVSGAGDVNGDGFADVIVGVPDELNSGVGSARVISGSDGGVLYEFVGDAAGDLFGFTVSGAGDVNGDGVPDLLASAPTKDNSSPPYGSARVFSGSDGSVLHTFVGDPTTDFFGRSASGAGDVNGDGFADLIVGIPPSDSVRVFSGADGSVLYSFSGDSAGDLFGRVVSGAGDVNKDGFDDLIVSAPQDDNNGDGSGIARVFSGFDGNVCCTPSKGIRQVTGFARSVVLAMSMAMDMLM